MDLSFVQIFPLHTRSHEMELVIRLLDRSGKQSLRPDKRNA